MFASERVRRAVCWAAKVLAGLVAWVVLHLLAMMRVVMMLVATGT
jgi:hypothetical protein